MSDGPDGTDSSLDSKQDLLCNGSRRSVIRRSGDVNVAVTNLKMRSRYLQDIYTTLVDMRWRWTLLIFFMAFIVCWMGFAFVYFMIIKVHGDDLSNYQEGFTPCLQHVKTFTGSFLFSLETQHTIGYGYRYITEECPEAIITMCIQSIVGVMIQAFMVGVVFAKLTRPKKRTNTLLFSRIAAVCLRNHRLCLMFRVADMRKSFIIGATVKAQLIRRLDSAEGETIPYHQSDVSVATEGGSENLLFIWPLTILHVIDESSPFYDMSAIDLMNNDFELVVYLEGTAESTGTSMQARYSYQPSKILWGHRFTNLVYYSSATENYAVDFSHFNSTTEIPTPLCSARELAGVMEKTKDQLICYSPESDQLICLQPEVLCKKQSKEEDDQSHQSVDDLDGEDELEDEITLEGNL